MTTQDKAQAIEKRIHEVCPELQELSFGCEVSRVLSGNGRIKDGGQSIRGFVLTKHCAKKKLEMMLLEFTKKSHGHLDYTTSPPPSLKT